MNKQKPLNDIALTSTTGQLSPTVLQHWYDSYRGQATLQQLLIPIQRMTADVFGYYALELGLLAPHQTFLAESRISHHILLGRPDLASPFIDLMSTWDALPFEFGTLDLVLSTHSLELSPNPKAVLAEIERVLMPEGHCILIGFNPFSGLGLTQWAKTLTQYTFPHPWQIEGWLADLGLEVLETKFLSYRPDWGGMRFWHYTRWWERSCQRLNIPFSNLYIIHACKKVTPLIPTSAKRKWWKPTVLKPINDIAVGKTPNPLKSKL